MKKIIKKVVPPNAKIFQAKNNFLKISKPCDICWGTRFVRKSWWGTLHCYPKHKNTVYIPDKLQAMSRGSILTRALFDFKH